MHSTRKNTQKWKSQIAVCSCARAIASFSENGNSWFYNKTFSLTSSNHILRLGLICCHVDDLTEKKEEKNRHAQWITTTLIHSVCLKAHQRSFGIFGFVNTNVVFSANVLQRKRMDSRTVNFIEHEIKIYNRNIERNVTWTKNKRADEQRSRLPEHHAMRADLRNCTTNFGDLIAFVEQLNKNLGIFAAENFVWFFFSSSSFSFGWKWATHMEFHNFEFGNVLSVASESRFVLHISRHIGAHVPHFFQTLLHFA